MFDIGFWELTLIGVIALLVVGPDRLPGMARTVGFWVGRMRRYVAHVRDDIERELRADELREIMRKSELDGLKDAAEEVGNVFREAGREIQSLERDAAVEKAPGPPSAAPADAGRAIAADGAELRPEAGAPAASAAEGDGARDDSKASQAHDERPEAKS